jgi:hypothetical protein
MARKGEKRNVYTLLVRKSETKRPLGRPRRSWGDKTDRDLVEIQWGGGGLDWYGSGYGKVEGS